MKFFKGLFLILMTLCMVIILILLQVQFTVQKTILSSEYFEEVYEKSNMSDAVSEIIENEVNSLNTSFSKLSSGSEEEGVDITTLIDKGWLEDEVEKIAFGFYGFIAGDVDALPSLDIEPIKDMVVEFATDQIMSNSMIQESMGLIEVMLASYDLLVKAGVPIDDEALAELAVGEDGQNLEVEMVKFMLETNESLDDSLTSEQRMEALAEGFIKDQLNLDEIKTELDFDDFYDEIFPEENPLSAAKTIVEALKTTLFWALLVLLLYFVLIVIFTAFTPSSIFGWLSAPIMAGGLFGIVFGLLGLFAPFVTKMSAQLSFEGLSESSQNVADFVLTYIQGISLYLLITGSILFVVSIIFIIMAAILKKRSAKREKPKGAAIMVLRIVFVVLLLLAMFVTTAYFYMKIYDEINAAMAVIDSAESYLDKDVIMDALSKTINLNIPDFGGSN